MGILFDVGPSESPSASPDGHLRAITGLSLVNPAGAAGQGAVKVWADDGYDEYPIGTLSSEAPIVAVRPQVVVGDEFVLRHDAAGSTVRFYGRVLSHEEEMAALGEVEEAVAALGGVEEEVTVDQEDEEEVDVLDDGDEDEALSMVCDPDPVFDDEEKARPAKRKKMAHEE